MDKPGHVTRFLPYQHFQFVRQIENADKVGIYLRNPVDPWP